MTFRVHASLPPEHQLLPDIADDPRVDMTPSGATAHAALSDDPTWLQAVGLEHPAVLRILVDVDPRVPQAIGHRAIAHHVLTTDATAHDIGLLIATRDEASMSLLNPMGQRARLPPLAVSTKRLMAVLDDPEVDAPKLKRAMQRDPALIAKTLQIANSPVFRRQGTVATLDRAIVLMGLQSLRMAALSSSFFKPIRGVPARFLEAARDTGLLTASAVRTMVGDDAEAAITAAMLVDIGQIVLLQHHRDYPSLLAAAAQTRTPLHRLEYQAYRTTHAEQGARLLSAWGIPHATCKAVAMSHTPKVPSAPGQSEQAVIYAASALVHAVRHEQEPPAALPWFVEEPYLRACEAHLAEQLRLEAA